MGKLLNSWHFMAKHENSWWLVKFMNFVNSMMAAKCTATTISYLCDDVLFHTSVVNDNEND